MLFITVFALTFVSGFVSITGGNGIILMPSLLLLGIDAKQVMLLIRVSGLVFILFNFMSIMSAKQIPAFSKRDLGITAISCLTIVFFVNLLMKLNDTSLICVISIILIGLFILVVFRSKIRIKNNSWPFIVVMSMFSGICGSTVGGAGLTVSILYILIGYNHITAIQKRIVPALIIQTTAFFAFMSSPIKVPTQLLCTVIAGTAISSFLSTRLLLKLNPKSGKILFYASFAFSIGNLLQAVVGHILRQQPLP